LDLERPAKLRGHRLGQRDVEARVRDAASMHGERRQILVQTDF
jgi:hypothetical protein